MASYLILRNEMNQYLPDLQSSKSRFVRLRLATKCRHLSVIRSFVSDLSGRSLKVYSVSRCVGNDGKACQGWWEKRSVLSIERYRRFKAFHCCRPTRIDRHVPSCRNMPSVSVTDQSSTIKPSLNRLIVMPLKRTVLAKLFPETTNVKLHDLGR